MGGLRALSERISLPPTFRVGGKLMLDKPACSAGFPFPWTQERSAGSSFGDLFPANIQKIVFTIV
jgi:hypothetical protein